MISEDPVFQARMQEYVQRVEAENLQLRRRIEELTHQMAWGISLARCVLARDTEISEELAVGVMLKCVMPGESKAVMFEAYDFAASRVVLKRERRRVSLLAQWWRGK